MFRNKNPQNTYKIFVEVLQNGEVLSSISRPFHKPSVIKLTSDPKGELSAPFYPLPTDVDLIKITKRGAEIDLDPNWEGFTTFEGRIEDISSHRKSHYTHIMKQGDYGSIAYNDLRVLIRIGKDRLRPFASTGPTGEYRGSLIKFWFQSPVVFKTQSFGLMAAAWILAGIIVGLIKRPDMRPKTLADLEPVYTLPFIYPRHLELLPEATQGKLNRRNLVSSVFNFYNDFTKTVIGYQGHRSPMIFDSTQSLYEVIYKDQKQKIAQLEQEQLRLEDRVLQDKLNALIYLPTVRGETLAQTLLRLKDKIRIAHQNFSQNLELRKETTAKFHDDRKYQFDQYQSVSRFSQPKEFKPWEMSRDELAMYDEAKEMARFAANQQDGMKQHREPITAVSRKNSRPITIAPENSQISFVNPQELRNLSNKISQIQASTFDLRKAGMIKEPLIGAINPKIISSTISKNSFDLQLCFELALRRNQKLAGTMEWQWRLDSRGKISDIELLSSSINDRRMIRCVRKKIARWKFPRPRKGSIEIRHPFSFNPAKG